MTETTMPPKVTAIFFDIGDTLVFDDPPLVARVRAAIDATGLAYDADRLPAAYRAAEDHAMSQYLLGVPFDHPDVLAAGAALILERLAISGLDYDTLIALRDHYVTVPYTRAVHPAGRNLLETLTNRGFVLGAISDWDTALPSLLASLGIAEHFRAVAVSAIVGVTKPNPRLFQAALDAVGVNPSEAIHIGDYYELDVAGARAAGMTPILFDWKQRTPAADCLRVTTFAELESFLLAVPPA